MIIRGSKKLFYWSVAGAVIFVIGLLLAFVLFPLAVDDQIRRRVVLKNGTDQFERWRELPVGIEFKIYLFQVKNWEAVTYEGAYPDVEEIGPYVYKEFRRKENITYDEDTDSLTYVQYTHFEFDPELSNGLSEDDRIVILNAGLNAIFQLGSKIISGFLMELLVDPAWDSMFPDKKGMFFEGRVGDIIFDGYTFCEPPKWRFTSGLLCILASLLDIPLLELQDDYSLKFSFFNFKQDKHDGIFTVNAGNEDVSKIGLITEWNGYTYNTIWKDRMSQCNKIKGRDGTIYAPGLKKEDVIDVYSTEICRTGVAEYDGEDEVDGVTVQRRVLGRNTLANPETYPENDCYCMNQERDMYGRRKCLPDGFRDLSPCYLAAVVASYPHFLFGDEEYSKTVTGLHPSKEDHQTVLMVEPITGTPMSGRKRLQFNMVLRPIPGIAITQQLNYSICPIAWIEEGMLVPEDLIATFRTLLHVALTAVEVIQWLIVAIGAALFLICGGLYFYKLKKSEWRN